MTTLLEQIPTEMKRAGKEHAGPCPWCGGKDRFTVSLDEGEAGLFWCRRCERGGDGIDLLRDLHGVSFPEACARLGLMRKVRSVGGGPTQPTEHRQKRSAARSPQPRLSQPAQPPTDAPGPAWQEAARAFVQESRAALHADTKAARTARAWLAGRGFTMETARAAGLGLNASERRPLRTAWGLPPKEDRTDGGALWLPRGIVIPWETKSEDSGGALWKVNMRRPNGDVVPGHDWKGRKYQLIAGGANALYGAGRVHAARPVVMVEGEFDALAIRQATGLAAVATGSTHGARRVRWAGRLAACPLVLVAFDADEAGEEAARYWTEALGPQARRWRPYWGDPAGMLKGGGTEAVRGWIEAGLRAGGNGSRGNSSETERRLQRPRVRWAYPPCAGDWLAWTPGADRGRVPPGLTLALF